ncbi:hypothetical protein J6590_079456 [Homalodisca vitripennis]|nr:hypothetical protein J6590_079456 [Homalodisca vitripennis]
MASDIVFLCPYQLNSISKSIRQRYRVQLPIEDNINILDAFKTPTRLPLSTPNSREQRCTRRYLSKIRACLPPSNCAAALSMEGYQAYW